MPDGTPRMVETKDLEQLRQLSLELVRQLWVGQDAVWRSVAKAASESSLDSSSSYNSEKPLPQEIPSMFPRASCPQDANQSDSCDMSSPGGAISGLTSFPPAKCQEFPSPLRPHLAPSPTTSDSNDPDHSTELKAQVPRSILHQQSKPSKPRVTFNKESPVPAKSWRLRPYLGYDWIAGSLDNRSPISSKPDAFFLKLQAFREANKEECIHSDLEPQFLGLQESGGAEEDHECVYCYRVNRRLFLVPSDPGTPCRLCGTPRDQWGPETLAEPAQVRVSIPLAVLDPPHRYHSHRRKSFDASDTLALPRHCLLGWNTFPPKSEKNSVPKSLDLWSCVTSEAQHQKLSAGPSHLVWSGVPWSRPGDCRVLMPAGGCAPRKDPSPTPGPNPRHPSRLQHSLPATPSHPRR